MKLLKIVAIATIISACSTTIKGYIVQENGQSIDAQDGKVNISYLDGPGPQQILDIKKDGSFETHKKLTPGNYLVEPLIPGYSTNSVRVFLDESQTVKIIAKPIDQNPSKAIQVQRDHRLDRGSGGAKLAPPKL